MNWFKRTWLSIIRRPKKAFALFLVAFVMGNLLAGSLGIIMTCNQIQSKLKKELGATANITGTFEEKRNFINYDKSKDVIHQYFNVMETISKDHRVVSGEYHINLDGFGKNDVDDKNFTFYGTNVAISNEFVEKKHTLSDGSRYLPIKKLKMVHMLRL